MTLAFVLVAGVSSAALAVVTYGMTSRQRWQNFHQRSDSEVEVALALAPEHLDDASFERLVRVYQNRTGPVAVAVAIRDEQSFSTSDTLDVRALPPAMLDPSSTRVVVDDLPVNGADYYVVSELGPERTRYVFLFALDQVIGSLAELRLVLVLGWLSTVAGVAAVGVIVTRRTLRPVRRAAEAAEAMAGGNLDARLDATGTDEFSRLADSFNEMAETLAGKLEELQESADRERRFTADLAHDLRTPLTGMAATARLLQDDLDSLPESASRPLGVLIHDVFRLRDLVLDLLELSRLDARSEPVQPETLDVAKALDSVVTALHLPDEVTVTCPDDLHVRAEPARLHRILGNLIANGVTHGGGPVEIVARSVGEDVHIEVRDHGLGIPEPDLDRVFSRFYKGDASRAGGGSGLGLAISREHARAQGGDLVAANHPGGGACFTLRLPGVARP